MQYKKFHLGVLTSFILLSGSVLAAPACKSMNTLLNERVQSGEKLPSKVCVFDIDNTLVNNKQNNKAFPGAQAAINKCLDEGFGVALLTLSTGYRTGVVKSFNFESKNQNIKYDLGKCNYLAGMYTDADTKAGKKPINPIYLSSKKGNHALKGQGMDRIMRTYFGVSTGGSYIDESNPWLKQYREKNGPRTLPDDVKLSGCMVLFDDNLGKPEDKAILAEVKAFNEIYGTQFQYVKVNPTTGVTEEDVNAGFEKLKTSCPE